MSDPCHRPLKLTKAALSFGELQFGGLGAIMFAASSDASRVACPFGLRLIALENLLCKIFCVKILAPHVDVPNQVISGVALVALILVRHKFKLIDAKFVQVN